MILPLDLMTQDEVASLLRKRPRAIAALRASGKLAYLPGRPIMIPRSAVDAYLASALIIKTAPVKTVRIAHQRTK